MPIMTKNNTINHNLLGMGYCWSGESPGTLPGPAAMSTCSRPHTNSHRIGYLCAEVLGEDENAMAGR